MNNPAYSKDKLDWLALVAAIELLSVGECAAVVDADGIPCFGLASALYGVCDLDREFYCESGGCEEGEEDWDVHRGGE